MICRIKAFILWAIYPICTADLYLKLNGYDPDKIGKDIAEYAKEACKK